MGKLNEKPTLDNKKNAVAKIHSEVDSKPTSSLNKFANNQS